MTMSSTTKARPLFDPPIVRRAMVDSFLKLESAAAASQPGDVHRVRRQHPDDGPGRLRAVRIRARNRPAFIFGVSAWLWFTVLFANFAEAMAEGRGKAQADSLRATRRDVQAKKLDAAAPRRRAPARVGRDAAKGRCRAGRSGRFDSQRRRSRSKASPRSMKARSRAKAPRSFAKAAAIAAASPAARACFPIGSSCASRPTRARRFSTA